MSSSSTGSIRWCHTNWCCKCGKTPKIVTSWTEKNPCRRFKGCPTYDGIKTDCNFFEWIDPELEWDWYKENLYKLHCELRKLKREKVEFDWHETVQRNIALEFELRKSDERNAVLEHEVKKAKKIRILYFSLGFFLVVINLAMLMNLVLL